MSLLFVLPGVLDDSAGDMPKPKSDFSDGIKFGCWTASLKNLCVNRGELLNKEVALFPTKP